MPASRTIHEINAFSFDIQEEPGKRTHGADGTPLDEPEDITLHVLVLYDQDPITGALLEYRYRYMPETWDVLKGKVHGDVDIALATAADLAQLKHEVPVPGA